MPLDVSEKVGAPPRLRTCSATTMLSPKATPLEGTGADIEEFATFVRVRVTTTLTKLAPRAGEEKPRRRTETPTHNRSVPIVSPWSAWEVHDQSTLTYDFSRCQRSHDCAVGSHNAADFHPKKSSAWSKA